MKQDRALPFLTLSGAALRATPWACSLNGAEQIYNPTTLPKWDYASRLDARRRIEVDFDTAAQLLELPKGELAFRVCVSSGTGQGSIPRSTTQVCAVNLTTDSPASELVLSLNGDSLSVRLKLSTVVTLASDRPSGSPLSPKLQGARLWSDDIDISIEGEAPRFPISNVSFNRSFAGKRHAGAPWYVHWSATELDRDFSGALRLYVNSDNTDISAKIRALDESTLQAMMFDVMRQAIDCLLDADLAIDPVSFEPGSIGQQAEQWTALAFPGQSIDQLRALRSSRPGDYAGAILAAAEIGER